jgi:hypothetical protein
MGHPRFAVKPLLNLPRSAVDRLKNQSRRNTPPHLLQSAAARGFQSPRRGEIKDGPKFRNIITEVATVELHALDARDQVLEKVGEAPGWIKAHLNPSEVERTIKTNWVDVKVPGLTHPIIHYGNTDAQSVKLTLFFDAFLFVEAFLPSEKKQKENSLAFGVESIDKANRFLEACNYERTQESDGPIDGAPPRMFFFWPNAFSLRCVLESVDFKYLEFAHTGHITRFTADLVLKEVRDDRLSFENVLSKGARRFDPPKAGSAAGVGGSGNIG